MPPLPHSPIQLSLATPALARRLARLDRAAFAPTALHKALHGSVPDPIEEHWRTKQLIHDMHPWHHVRGRTPLAASVEGKGWLGPTKSVSAGYAMWEEIAPDRVLTDAERDVILPSPPRPPAEMEFDLAQEFGAPVAREAYDPALGDRFYLIAIAVDPAHQRRGVATALTRWGLDRADAAGLPTYLHATPEAAPLYFKFGFEQSGPDLLAPNGAFHLIPMGRPARTTITPAWSPSTSLRLST